MPAQYDQRYRKNPNLWATEILDVFLWSKQREIVDAVMNNRKTAVRASHSVGKTFLAAYIALFFLYTEIPSKVITTAPTGRQVRHLLWREINKLFNRKLAPQGFPGRALQTQLDISEDWFAIGISPDSSVGAQGFHEKNILVIMDEAPGVRPEIVAGLETLMTSANAHSLWIGNPIETAGHFYQAFTDPEFSKHHISAFDSPNFTNEQVPGELRDELVSQEWVEDKKRVWGEDSPLYKSKVLGDFPPGGVNQLIPLSLCEEAKEREVEHLADEKAYLGIDVARYGPDRTVYTVTKGNEIIEQLHETKKGNTEVAGRAKHLFKIFDIAEIRVDDIGVGAGVVDILFEAEFPVVGVNAASRAVNEPDKYFNRRAELWFNFADWLRYGKIPDSDLLIRDLCSVHYSFRSDGTYQIESKDDIIKRLTYSPDFGDSAILATPPNLGRIRGSLNQESQSRSFSTKSLGEKLTGEVSNYNGL